MSQDVKINSKKVLVEDWSDIDWKQIDKAVIKLRRRIFDTRKCAVLRSVFLSVKYFKISVFKLCEPCTLRGVCTAPTGGWKVIPNST
jgi:hypothetical protein